MLNNWDLQWGAELRSAIKNLICRYSAILQDGNHESRRASVRKRAPEAVGLQWIFTRTVRPAASMQGAVCVEARGHKREEKEQWKSHQGLGGPVGMTSTAGKEGL